MYIFLSVLDDSSSFNLGCVWKDLRVLEDACSFSCLEEISREYTRLGRLRGVRSPVGDSAIEVMNFERIDLS